MEMKINVTPELRDELSVRVAEKTLNLDKIFFTSEPLESHVEPPENATSEQLVETERKNREINENNENLCREAKSLKTLLADIKILETPSIFDVSIVRTP